MPPVVTFSPELQALLRCQDGVVSRRQLAEHGFANAVIARRVRSGAWQCLLPDVFLVMSGVPSRRQLLVAALLWGGPDSAVDGPDACSWYGLVVDCQPSSSVHIVVPFGSPARSMAFVRVRRTIGTITLGGVTPRLRYVDPATALLVAARGADSDRSAIATLSRGLQLGITDVAGLHTARSEIGDKWCRGVDRALLAVGVGVRSPAENDARELILTSRVLPEPRWNQWVDLGDGGGPLCLDALWDDAGYLHEVNGKKHHAWGEQFEGMQARHDRLTVVGLIAMHNGPVRIRRQGPVVLAELERGYRRYAGRGMPAGVRLIADPLRPGHR